MNDLRQLGIYVGLQTNTIKLDGVTESMANKGHWSQANIDDHWRSLQEKQDTLEPTIEQASLESDLEASNTTLEANIHKPADTQEFTTNEQYDHLSTNQKEIITTLLTKHKELFQGTRGKWKGSDVTLSLK